MTNTRGQAVKNALASTAYDVGMCMKWTRTMLGRDSVGDVDRDGDADAVDGWKSCKHRHPDDRNPPAGVPVFWSGGSKGHGHAALSLGGGMIRTIDRPTSGRVGTVPLSDPERAWGLHYLGWAEDIGGLLIPLDAPAKVDPKPLTAPGRIARARLLLRRAEARAEKRGDRARLKAIRTALRALPKR